MLKPHQEVLLNLIKEIKRACKHCGAEYVFLDRLAWDAVKYNGFHDSTFDAFIGVPKEDVHLLIDTLAKRNKNRTFVHDTTDDGKRVLRYVATDSLYIDMLKPIQKCPGIAVNIVELDFENKTTSYTFNDKEVTFVYEQIFPGTKMPFEEEMFLVPAQYDEYFSAIVDKNWQKKSYPGHINLNHFEVICEPNIPYAKYLAIPGVKKLLHSKRWQYRKRFDALQKKKKPLEKRLKVFSNRRKASICRIHHWEQLYPRKDELLAYFEQGNHKELEKTLDAYICDIIIYKKSGIGLHIDNDIDALVKPFLIERQGEAFYEQYDSMIHEKHRQNIDERLREYGVDHPFL